MRFTPRIKDDYILPVGSCVVETQGRHGLTLGKFQSLKLFLLHSFYIGGESSKLGLIQSAHILMPLLAPMAHNSDEGLNAETGRSPRLCRILSLFLNLFPLRQHDSAGVGIY